MPGSADIAHRLSLIVVGDSRHYRRDLLRGIPMPRSRPMVIIPMGAACLCVPTSVALIFNGCGPVSSWLT